MKAALRWMAENHVAANLLMMVFVVGGLFMLTNIRQEIFPEVMLDAIQVKVVYPGATPEEVEDGIILQIESNIRGIEGIKQIKSIAAEGYGVVTAELLSGVNADRILQDIKSEVDRIITFPEDAEEPVISKLVNRRQVLSVIVYGNLSEKSLRQQAELIRDDLLDLPEITQVSIGGVRPYEIDIEIPEETLRRYGMTLEDVARRIRKASLDIPAGVIRTEGGEILIRTKEKRYTGREYESIGIITLKDGTEITLGEIADVRDGFAETDTSARFDGKPAAIVTVFRVGDERPIAISDAVKKYMHERQEVLPPGVGLAIWHDRSEVLKSRMQLLEKNAVMGLILVLITLSLFLQMRLALWVMLGIPISFLGAFFLMPAMHVTINMISLFAFIMALGMVVDDAIVVGENIFEHRQRGEGYQQAAVNGVQGVAVPVIFAVLTSVTAFIPLVFVSGVLGKFISVIPLVVISVLSISLVESLFVLPAHLSLGHGVRASDQEPGRFERMRLRVSAWLQAFIDGPYTWFLGLCIRYRYVSLAVAVAILLMSMGLVGGGIIKFRFMPKVDGDVIKGQIKMIVGTPVEHTAAVEEYIEHKAREAVAELREKSPTGEPLLLHIFSVVGGTMPKGGPAGSGGTSGANLAEVALLLTPGEERTIPASVIEALWRKKIGEIPGIEALSIDSDMVHMGANIDIQLAHKDYNVLIAAADRLKEALAQYPGLGDIADSHSEGKREIKIRLTREGRVLGVTEESLGRQIRAAYYGAEALRFQRGRDEVKVMVRYPEVDRRTLASLDDLRIRLPGGGEIPLRRVATIEYGRGYSTINRTDQKRVIDVTATVSGKKANAEEIVADLQAGILKQLAADYPGLSYSLEGEGKERRESMDSMKKGFMLAMFGVYALLAIPFRSYIQPFIIMASIPFGIIGAILGHLVMGFDISILSMFGIVALSGVVVNDSLLLIDYVNQRRREGSHIAEALMTAGRRRFRPILLTSLTTFFGLAPLIFERSFQAQFLIPMALSLAYGVMAATGITLLLIPSLYYVLDDIRQAFRHGK